jgi:hypothetical protein
MVITSNPRSATTAIKTFLFQASMPKVAIVVKGKKPININRSSSAKLPDEEIF